MIKGIKATIKVRSIILKYIIFMRQRLTFKMKIL